MTYNDALELKSKLETKFESLFITPKAENDFKNYMGDFHKYKFNDDSAKKYSKDSNFNVTSIKVVRGYDYIIKNRSKNDI